MTKCWICADPKIRGMALDERSYQYYNTQLCPEEDFSARRFNRLVSAKAEAAAAGKEHDHAKTRFNTDMLDSSFDLFLITVSVGGLR